MPIIQQEGCGRNKLKPEAEGQQKPVSLLGKEKQKSLHEKERLESLWESRIQKKESFLQEERVQKQAAVLRQKPI